MMNGFMKWKRYAGKMRRMKAIETISKRIDFWAAL